MKYAGEALEVAVTAKNFDNKTALDNTSISTVTVSIIGPGSALVVDEHAMGWDTSRWVYLWATPTVPGGYKARVTIIDPAGHKSVEWQDVTLLPPRAVAVP